MNTLTLFVYLSLSILFLSGCESQPTPFETGEEVRPPSGCVMARSEGRDVDC